MNKKSFPIVKGLSTSKLSAHTMKMTTGKPEQKSPVIKPKEISASEDQQSTEMYDEPVAVAAEILCPRCNRTVFTDDKFCAFCGEPIR